MKRRSFLSLTLSGIGYVVLGNVMCLIMTMALAMFGVSLFTNIVSIFCCAAVFYMLVFTVAWKDGTAERSLVKHGRVDKPLKFRWIAIGMIMFAVAAIPTIVLLLNKLFFPETDTLYIYRFISASAYPFVNAFVPAVEANIDEWHTTLRQFDNMSVWFPVLMLVYYLLIPAVTQLGYYMGF
ncbi:MAG: hypothetical protein E7478_08295, partial [Ruminococcaceae bacterium]|nr:hypothetical protein [Oscillospiraceae bacterium]